MDTITGIFRFALILIEVLIIFNLLIIVHELGHFLAARWRGLVVERFGIWFGKPLWKKTINGVQYSLGSIPAGGFVALPQMAPMEAVEGKNETAREELPPVSVLDKIIVALAGPLFSFGLAFVFACLVFVIGRPTTESEVTTTIGYVDKGGPADVAGLRPGDEVLEVDGKPVSKFVGMGESISWRVIRSEGKTIPFKIRRDGVTRTIDVGWSKEPKKTRWGRESLRQVRIGPLMTPKVGAVEPGSPAERAGLEAGDLITKVNGERIYNPIVLSDVIEANPHKPVEVTVQRGPDEINYSMVAELKELKDGRKRYLIGVEWDLGEIKLSHPGPVEQIVGSVNTMFNMIGALFSPKSDVKPQHFSGPVGIMNLYYKMFESEQGWRLAIWFSVFFNVNLAILNLLPIPVLDGGHITLAIIEGIRRKPINVKVLEIVQTACAMLIIGYMLYVTFYDVQDVIPFEKGQQQEEKTSE